MEAAMGPAELACGGVIDGTGAPDSAGGLLETWAAGCIVAPGLAVPEQEVATNSATPPSVVWRILQYPARPLQSARSFDPLSWLMIPLLSQGSRHSSTPVNSCKGDGRNGTHIEAARFIGDNETARTCEEIRQQEDAAARKIQEMIPTVAKDLMA